MAASPFASFDANMPEHNDCTNLGESPLGISAAGFFVRPLKCDHRGDRMQDYDLFAICCIED